MVSSLKQYKHWINNMVRFDRNRCRENIKGSNCNLWRFNMKSEKWKLTLFISFLSLCGHCMLYFWVCVWCSICCHFLLWNRMMGRDVGSTLFAANCIRWYDCVYNVFVMVVVVWNVSFIVPSWIPSPFLNWIVMIGVYSDINSTLLLPLREGGWSFLLWFVSLSNNWIEFVCGATYTL